MERSGGTGWHSSHVLRSKFLFSGCSAAWTHSCSCHLQQRNPVTQSQPPAALVLASPGKTPVRPQLKGCCPPAHHTCPHCTPNHLAAHASGQSVRGGTGCISSFLLHSDLELDFTWCLEQQLITTTTPISFLHSVLCKQTLFDMLLPYINVLLPAFAWRLPTLPDSIPCFFSVLSPMFKAPQTI